MESLNKKINMEKRADDQKALDKKMQSVHTKDLGLDIPQDYFSKSKIEILAKVGNENKGKLVSLYSNKIFWAAAAGIALLIAISIYRTNLVPQIDAIPTIVSDSIERLNTEGLVNEDAELGERDILITSLFVEETEIDEFVNNYMLEEAISDELNFK